MESIQKSAHEVALKTSGDREALREFHYRRYDSVTDYEFVEEDDPVVVVHTAVPNAISDQRFRVDPSDLVEDRQKTRLIGETRQKFGFNPSARNAQATSSSTLEDSAASKIVHDIGVVETVSTIVFDQREEPPKLRTETLEKSLVESVVDTVRFFDSQDADQPALVTASFLNIRGASMTRGTRRGHRSALGASEIDTPIAEVYLQRHPRKELDQILKPIWDGAGILSSDYIDKDGEWTIDLD